MRQRLLAAAAVACAALVAFPAAGRGAPAAISGNDFVARLDNARRLAEADAAQPAPPKMQAVREALGLPLDIDLAGGAVHVPADGLLDGLRGTTAEDFRNAGDHLAAMEDAAKAAVSATLPDPARMAVALHEAFRGIRTQPSFFERIRHDIWVFVVSLWQRITRAVNGVPLPHGLLVLVAAGILAVVVVGLIRRLGYVVPERTAGGPTAARQRKADWERLAREAMARGDLAGAVRARYGALLAALAGRGIVPDTPSLTAGECRRAVAGGLPDAYPVVTKATTVFESVMYGRAEATADGVETLAAAELIGEGPLKRPWILLGILAALIVAGAVLSGPSAGDDAGPHGTLALRRYLGAMGLSIRNATTPPGGSGVFVLLTDLRDADQAGDLVSWARAGGTLVIADPESETVAAAGVGTAGRVGHYAFGPAKLAPGCVAPEIDGVHTLAVDAGDSVLDSGAGGVGCFPISEGAFEVTTPVGRGKVVVLGGISPLTNALLGTADNAAFALGVFGAGGPVVFGPPLPPGAAGPKGLLGSLPAGARIVLFQIALAAVAFALVRGRRLGRPTFEEVPSPVPSGELVHAVARLYRSARARAFAGDTLRRATRRRLRSRLGLGPEPPVAGADEALSSTVGQLIGTRPDDVQRLLHGPSPATEEELISLGRGLEELRRRVEGSWT